MNKLKLIGLSFIAMGLMACSGLKLSPDGPFKGDKTYATAIITFNTIHDTLAGAVKIESANHEFFKAKLPEFTQFTDYLRDNQRRLEASAKALISAYKADPSAENKTAMQASLDVMNQSLVEASKYISQSQKITQ